MVATGVSKAPTFMSMQVQVLSPTPTVCGVISIVQVLET